MDGGYQLEMAHRKMAELQHEVEHDALVKELKEAEREQHTSFWRRLIAYSLRKLGKRPGKAAVKSGYSR